MFLLIGKTSALTMNIAGVIKDWMLIFFSFYLFKAPVTTINLLGYAFCCRCARDDCNSASAHWRPARLLPAMSRCDMKIDAFPRL